jgi:hypothetical protein
MRQMPRPSPPIHRSEIDLAIASGEGPNFTDLWLVDAAEAGDMLAVVWSVNLRLAPPGRPSACRSQIPLSSLN